MADFPRSPNILLVMIDCMRADYFYEERGPDCTSNLTALLDQGARFSSFYSVTSTTTPCTASVVTGAYPITHGVRAHSGFRLRPGLRTLAERLRSSGYHTVARMSGPLGCETDIFRGFSDYEHRAREKTVLGKFGDRFFEELRDLDACEPWFVFLHIWCMHMPLPARPAEVISYRAPLGALLWLVQKAHNSTVWKKLAYEIRSALGRPHLHSSLLNLYKPTAYERSLVSLDRAFIGRLTREIDPAHTIVALIGDHGEFVDPRFDTMAAGLETFMRPTHGFHVYEYLTRVPFLLRGPGVPEGQRSDVLSSHIDVAPTLLGLVGVDSHDGSFDGKNLVKCLQDGAPGHPSVFMEAVGGGNLENDRYIRAVRHHGWKLAEAPWTAGFEDELYCLSDDPLERDNLAEEHPEVVTRLKQMLAERFAEDADSPGSQYGEESRMDAEEQEAVEDRLRKLGYIQ